KQIDVLRQLLKTLEEQQRAEEKDAVKLDFRVKAAQGLKALGSAVQQPKDDVQAKEVQRLHVLIQQAKADVAVATGRLRQLQAELEQRSKTGPAQGAPGRETVAYLQRRLELLEQQQ